jgi:hypothetical protein
MVLVVAARVCAIRSTVSRAMRLALATINPPAAGLNWRLDIRIDHPSVYRVRRKVGPTIGRFGGGFGDEEDSSWGVLGE